MRTSAKLGGFPADKRGRDRSFVLLAAILETGEARLKANLLNLSATGALLDASVPPAVDAVLTLTRGSLEARGRVIWVNQHRFGIAFDHPVDEAVVAEHVEALQPRKRGVA